MWCFALPLHGEYEAYSAADQRQCSGWTLTFFQKDTLTGWMIVMVYLSHEHTAEGQFPTICPLLRFLYSHMFRDVTATTHHRNRISLSQGRADVLTVYWRKVEIDIGFSNR